jgi:transposase InsO family protein
VGGDCAGFRDTLRGSGVEPLRLPAKSPNLNASAERFVLSIKSECLDKIVPLSEPHLRRAKSPDGGDRVSEHDKGIRSVWHVPDSEVVME